MRNFIIPSLLLFSALMATPAGADPWLGNNWPLPYHAPGLASDQSAPEHDPLREVVHLTPQVQVMSQHPEKSSQQIRATYSKHQSLYGMMNIPIVFIDQNTRPDAVITSGQLDQKFLSTGDIIFAKILNPKLKPGMVISIIHQGEAVFDPKTRKKTVTEGWEVGLARINFIRHNIAELRITQSKEEIRVGDYLMQHRAEQSYYTDGPVYPEQSLSGHVMHTENNAIPAVSLSPISIDQGFEEGMRENYLIKIFSEDHFLRKNIGSVAPTPAQSRHGHLISHSPSSLAIVFKTFAHFSYALIIKTDTPVYQGDNYAVITREERQEQLAQ